MQKLKEFLLATFIILIPFQDTGLQNLKLGFLGTSPSFIPLSFLIVIHLIEWLFRNNEFKINKIFLFTVIYVITISLVYMMLTGIESHGRNLIFKTFNLSVLTFLFLYPIFFFDYKNIPNIGRYIQIAFVIAVVGVILHDLLAVDIVVRPGIFHASLSENWRPRGFTLEASHLSASILSLGLLSAHFTKKTYLKIITLAISVAITIFSASKGGLIALFLISMIMIFFKSQIKSWVRVFMVLVVIIGFMFLFEQLQTRFIGDMENTTSTATRSVLLCTSLVTFIHNPFGVGFSGFLPAIDKYMIIAINFIDDIFNIPLSFVEIFAYIGADTDKAISTKTFLFDYLTYFGFPFLILYILFHKKLISRLLKTNHIFLTASVIFCMVVISTYISGIGIYGIPLVYGVAFNEVYSAKSSSS